jgi:Sugar (and other) transporter.
MEYGYKKNTDIKFPRLEMVGFMLICVIYDERSIVISGVYPVIFYAMQLFKEVGTEIDESHALVFLGIIRFGMSVVTTVLARGFGRKQLLIVSAAGMNTTPQG